MGAVTQSLYFTGPRDLAIREEPLRAPGAGEVLVEALVSGISAGTELNVFRGHAPQWRQHMDRDTRLFLSDAEADWKWPARYGYALVGPGGGGRPGRDEARQGRSRLSPIRPMAAMRSLRKARRSRWAISQTPSSVCSSPT